MSLALDGSLGRWAGRLVTLAVAGVLLGSVLAEVAAARGLESLPMEAQSAISATLGSERGLDLRANPLQPDPLVQQGAKLYPTDPSGNVFVGTSVALSADGNTAMVGGFQNNNGLAAVWAFRRVGTVWSQDGPKLTTSTDAGDDIYGYSVALSADGNTAMVGGAGDNSKRGAAWAFTRAAGVWSQQDFKMIPSDEIGFVSFGTSVALSADGNTALIGGPLDDGPLGPDDVGAAWVFTRTGNVWSQQGPKLTADGGIDGDDRSFGWDVALSADGNTALIGGPGDNGDFGAAWAFTRAGTVWSQQGSKLTADDVPGNVAGVGGSVGLSSDGNTALIGNAGAAWVFTRAGTVWSQQGPRLTASDRNGPAALGFSVALSGDGNTALLGGFQDGFFVGAAWVFTRAGTVWSQHGPKLTASDAYGAAYLGTSVAVSGDGNTALVGGPRDRTILGAAWVFVVVPTVSGVGPSTGTTAGGTAVTITGSGFTGATKVAFGSTAATTFTVVSNTEITAVAPPGSAGEVDVTVTTPHGTSDTAAAADQFTYVAPATVRRVTPSTGLTAGGAEVTIYGSGFTGALGVAFGSTAATTYTVVSGSEITAVAPAGSPGAVDVTITTPYGTSPTSSADQFTYVAPPTVSGVSTSTGSTAGGTRVTITGADLAGTTSVSFGSTAAAVFPGSSNTEVTAIAPAGSPGTVDITVTTPYGTSATGGAGQFTYLAPLLAVIGPPLALKVTLTGINRSYRTATAVKRMPKPAVGCNQACTINVSLTVTAAQARKLHLKARGKRPVTIASGKATLKDTGVKTFVLKLKKAVAKTLQRQKKVSLTLSVSASATAHKTQTIKRGITFKR